VVVLLIIEDS